MNVLHVESICLIPTSSQVLSCFTELHDVNFVHVDFNIARPGLSGGYECAVILL